MAKLITTISIGDHSFQFLEYELDEYFYLGTNFSEPNKIAVQRMGMAWGYWIDQWHTSTGNDVKMYYAEYQQAVAHFNKLRAFA